MSDSYKTTICPGQKPLSATEMEPLKSERSVFLGSLMEKMREIVHPAPTISFQQERHKM